MQIKNQTFKNKEFKVIKGTTHPEYSFYRVVMLHIGLLKQ